VSITSLLTLSMAVLLGALIAGAVVRAYVRRRMRVEPAQPRATADVDLAESVRHAVTLLRLGSASRALRELEDALR